jgi:hypothetical protein
MTVSGGGGGGNDVASDKGRWMLLLLDRPRAMETMTMIMMTKKKSNGTNVKEVSPLELTCSTPEAAKCRDTAIGKVTV